MVSSSAAQGGGDADARVVGAWTALNGVDDPEIPGLSVVELGIVRHVVMQADGSLEVGLSPTYTGCPATDMILALAQQSLTRADVGAFRLKSVLAPAWSSDWISPAGRRKLAQYGIVPPDATSLSLRDLRRGDRPVACPRCRSLETECVSEFGSTPCKALLRCRACREPFEYFKCI